MVDLVTEQGRLQGAFSSMRAVSGMIGALVFTQVFAAALRADGVLHLPGAPYLVAAALLVCSLLGCLGARGRIGGEPSPESGREPAPATRVR